MKSLARAADHSVVVGNLRRLAKDSVVCRAIVALFYWPKVSAWLAETQRRILIGFGSEWSEQEERSTITRLDHLASTSRIVSEVTWLVTTPIRAWRESRLRRMQQRVSSWELQDKVWVSGLAIVAAVITHTVLTWLLSVPVYVLGWTTRVLMLVVGAICFRESEAVAMAWRGKHTPKQK